MAFARSRRYPTLLVSLLAVLALTLALVGAAVAQPVNAITVTDFVPANGATVPAGQPVPVSAFVISDTSITGVNAFLDGAKLDVQIVVGSGAVRAGFNTTLSFAPGSHTLRVTATNTAGETGEGQSTFTAVQGTTTATTTAATTTTAAATTATTTTTAATTAAATTTRTTTAVATTTSPRTTVAATVVTATAARLPSAGGPPLDPALLALLGAGAAMAGAALRRRCR
jgi:hypothetical protein